MLAFHIKKNSVVLLISASAAGTVFGDVYLHNPRGSNDRLFAATGNRQNANRLFDSQNNAKGGYNIGEASSDPATGESQFYSMAYFQSGSGQGEDSILPIELYYQHGCSSDELHCNVVFQYMCQPDGDKSSTWLLRDGSIEDTANFTVPKKLGETAAEMAVRRNADTNKLAGQQESWDSYNHCYLRKQNGGLFIADQPRRQNPLNYTSAIFTRQNPKGTRRGYECPEERDYYPYWHPNQWKDLAVWTDNLDSCSDYQQNSFSGTNTLGVCVKADGTRDAAQLLAETADNCTGSGFNWVQVYNYLEKAPQYTSQSRCTSKSGGRATYIWGVPYDASNFNNAECLVALPTVDCRQAPWSRPNHLGLDKETDEFPRYAWTLPYFPSQTVQRCVLRVRYNISSGDYDLMTTDASNNQVRPGVVAATLLGEFRAKAAGMRTWTNESRASIFTKIADLKEATKLKINQTIQNGDSPVRQDPRFHLFPDFPEVALAINTDQTGRVFEDRTHSFRLMPRTSQIPTGKKIYNLNVRGKRGNNVQVYNAVEYDFVPNNLAVSSSDLIHIQWTGSNHQPGDGQGKALTDRSNVVQIGDYADSYPLAGSNITMWRNARVYWTMFHSPALFQQLFSDVSKTASAARDDDPLSVGVRALKTKQFIEQAVTENGTMPVAPRVDADAQGPYDPEKNLDDDAKPRSNLQAMRKKRDTSPVQLSDQQLALAMVTGGYYWCINKAGCPSFVPDNFISSITTKPKLNPTLDQAPASFPGVVLSFSSGKYNYMSTRNNKFTNRSQKGRLVVS